MIDREVFFDSIRDELFGGALQQVQVDGMSVILAVWEYQAGGTPMTDDRWLAYMLATVFHETATRMWPITEYGDENYLQGKPYYPYVGRGFVQLTWEENYRYASTALSLVDERDLVEHPEMARDSLIATRGCSEEWQRGEFMKHKLGDYFNDETDDPHNARDIINPGDDEELIAGYHHTFLTAIRDATVGPVEVTAG